MILRLMGSYAPLTLTAITLVLASCQGGERNPATPSAPTAAPEIPTSTIAPSSLHVAAGSLGVYTLDLDAAAGTAHLEPVQRRTASAIGDQYAPDITPFLEESPCKDCFEVRALSLEPTGELNVDFALKHPFPTTVARADLSVFDTRAIMIVPGTTVFPGSPKIHTDGNGVPDLTVLGSFDTLINADGYTAHYDSKPSDPAYFNPPLLIAGSVNPYRNFFTEDDPDPTVEGNPLANRRFSQSPNSDVQRFTFSMTPGGSTLRAIVVLEAQYGASAMKSIPLGQPGSRSNPIYFLPAFNQLEAYRVAATVDSFLLAGAPGSFAQVNLEVEDWQAGMTGSATYGDFAQPGQIPFTSDVASVIVEVPGVTNTPVSKTVPDSGSGVFGDPYLYQVTFSNQAAAADGDYVGLISVVDDADGAEARATLSGSLNSFITYLPFTVTIAPTTGGNNPPTAVAGATPNPVASGATVNLTDNTSFDPDAGDSITLYEWDYDYSGVFVADSTSTTPNAASASYTNGGASAITRTAALRVTDEGFLTDLDTVVITINPTGPSCTASAPAAPTNFAVPNFPTPPYNGSLAANRITFTWTAVPADPCVLGYALFRNDIKASTGDVLVSDTNGNGTLEAVDAIVGTTYADATLSGVGFKTSNKQYHYKLVTVKNNGGGGVVISPLATAPRVYVFFDDYEDRSTIYGNNGYSGVTSGFVTGMVNNTSFPGGGVANGYGWQIAANGAQGNANTGSRFLDESASPSVVWGTLYGANVHQPYPRAANAFVSLDDGCWNSVGPNVWLPSATNPLAGTTFRRMKVYHRYQLETYFDGSSQVAAEVGYVAAIPESAWLTGTNQFNDYVYLPTIAGAGLKTYDSGGVSYPPPFLDQFFYPGAPNPQQQIPNMPFFAGDAATPTYGLPSWGASVFDLSPAASMASPIIMFAHTSDEFGQPAATFGWQLDDICMIAY